MDHDPPQIESTSITCIGCGYDLSGTPIGGRCPECGEPVCDSVVAVERGLNKVMRRGGRIVPRAARDIFLVIVCLVIGPFAILPRNHARELHEQGLMDELSLRFIETAATLGIMVFCMVPVIILALAVVR